MAATRVPTGLTLRAVRSLGPAVGAEDARPMVAQAAATTHRNTAAPELKPQQENTGGGHDAGHCSGHFGGHFSGYFGCT